MELLSWLGDQDTRVGPFLLSLQHLSDPGAAFSPE